MIQPEIIKIIGSKKDPLLKDYPEGNIKCIIQERDEDDDSEIVYIPNLKFIKGGNDIRTRSPYIALTSSDYEVIKWATNKNK